MASKFTDDRKARILQAVRVGAAGYHAAMAGGIAYSTLSAWLYEGQQAREKDEAGEELTDDERAKMEFLDQVDQAKAEVVEALMSTIQAASVDSWQAAAWKLERLYPQVYGRVVHTVQGDEEKPIVHKHKVDLSDLSYEQLLDIARALRSS